MSRPLKFDLNDRMLDLAAAVGHIVNQLPADRVGSHIAGQLVRCGTAPAAHYAEAQGAESRRDFVHKLRLALKELRESLAWLRLAARLDLAPARDTESAVRECDELIAILCKSVQTAQQNMRPGRP
jgi:four helix bundle protein